MPAWGGLGDLDTVNLVTSSGGQDLKVMLVFLAVDETVSDLEVVSCCFRFGEQHEALKGPVFALEPHQEPESS